MLKMFRLPTRDSNAKPQQHRLAFHQTSTVPTAKLRKKGCSNSTDIDDGLCSSRRIYSEKQLKDIQIHLYLYHSIQ